MNEKITNYVNGVFAPYEGVKSAAELKSDILADLQERFRELQSQGKDDDTAFAITIDSIGDIEQTVQEVANLSRSLERQVAINFSASNMPKSDLAGVTIHKGKFNASALRGSSFAGSVLTGSTFSVSDVSEANFDGTNLTDCTFSLVDCKGASFNKSVLVRTEFSKSDLARAKFIDVKMIDVKLSLTDLRQTVFENCVFDGVNFKLSDLRDLSFDGQTFIGTIFDKSMLAGATFRGAALKGVSFHLASMFSNRYFHSLKAACFDGATMDKLTYAALKGLGVDLSKVTVI